MMHSIGNKGLLPANLATNNCQHKVTKFNNSWGRDSRGCGGTVRGGDRWGPTGGRAAGGIPGPPRTAAAAAGWEPAPPGPARPRRRCYHSPRGCWCLRWGWMEAAGVLRWCRCSSSCCRCCCRWRGKQILIFINLVSPFNIRMCILDNMKKFRTGQLWMLSHTLKSSSPCSSSCAAACWGSGRPAAPPVPLPSRLPVPPVARPCVAWRAGATRCQCPPQPGTHQCSLKLILINVAEYLISNIVYLFFQFYVCSSWPSAAVPSVRQPH